MSKSLSLPLFFILFFSSSIAFAEQCHQKRRIYKGEPEKHYAIKLANNNWEECFIEEVRITSDPINKNGGYKPIDPSSVPKVSFWDNRPPFEDYRRAGITTALKCGQTGSIVDIQDKWIINKSNNKPVGLIGREETNLPGPHIIDVDECELADDGRTTVCRKGTIWKKYIDFVNKPIDILHYKLTKYECDSNDDFL